MKKSQLLTIVPRLGRQFKLSYEFKITKYGSSSYSYYAAMHMSTGSNSGSYGSRMPYVVYYETQVRVYAAISGNENSYKSFPRSLKNEWTTIEVSQTKKDGVYMYTVTIDGEEVHAEENKGAAVFSNMAVFASDPWNTVQPGVVRNISIQTSDTTISKAISNHQLPQRSVPRATATCRGAFQSPVSTTPAFPPVLRAARRGATRPPAAMASNGALAMLDVISTRTANPHLQVLAVTTSSVAQQVIPIVSR